LIADEPVQAGTLRGGGNIWFGTGPYKSLDDAKLARSTIPQCPAVEEPPAETQDNADKSN
jgi:hypothetical protein